MAGFTQADIDAAKQAYVANADYEETASLSKAKAFVTACRKLLVMIPKRAEQRQAMHQSVEFDPVVLQQEMNSARTWIANHPDQQTGGGVIHPDFADFRG